ncbi:MAG: 1-phosphofructokinase [Firmicutes bacterium]|nr:1-phosphofructokinase [Clostridiales bacterium]MBQ9931062.1 1-phosphofructokinase [Bacillota bacterium]
MIWTVTLNPAIDHIIYLDSFEEGTVNRSAKEEYCFGGKGINVSQILHQLGIESTALGFAGGFTGIALEEGLQKQGLHTDFIHLEKGVTRVNEKIISQVVTEINAPGPAIEEDALKDLFEKMQNIQEGDVLVLAGSLPASLPFDTYERFLRAVEGKGVRTVVDAEGDSLLKTLSCRPFLVKPNQRELEELFNVSCSSLDEILSWGKKLQEKGARNVLISMGEKGGVLLWEDGRIYRALAPETEIISAMGSGDSMVGGFLAGFLEKEDPEYALALGIAAGTATACSRGLAEKTTIEEFFNVTKGMTCQIEGGN